MKPEFEAYWNHALLKDQQKKIHFVPAERNKGPILETLKQHIDSSASGTFLEISSGSGQHISLISKEFPNITFQPTEFDELYIASIGEYIEDDNLTNVLKPLQLDVSQPVDNWGGSSFKPNSFDYVLNVNLMHVAPWACTEGLFKGTSTLLKPGGWLFTYGAFAVNGNISPESNVQFNENLKQHDPSWGLRDIENELKPLASNVGMQLIKQHDLPANNKLLVWEKTSQNN